MQTGLCQGELELNWKVDRLNVLVRGEVWRGSLGLFFETYSMSNIHPILFPSTK